jgi:hypothetical protein
MLDKPQRSRAKRIGIDALGYGAIVAAALTGWLPGPGGIPLLILGLSLLATNHKWAERLLAWVKSGSGKLADQIFNGHPLLKLSVDVCGIVFVAAAAYLLTHFTRSIARSAAVSLIIVSVILLLGNRQRFAKIKAKFIKP